MAEDMPRNLNELFNRFSLELAKTPTERLDEGIQNFIRNLAELFRADRSYVLLIDDSTQTLSTTHEFCAPGVNSRKGTVKNMPMARFPWFAGQLVSETVVSIPDVDALDGAAAEEQRQLRGQEVRHLVLVGLEIDGETAGAFGLDFLTPADAPDDHATRLLDQLAAVVSSSVHRRILAMGNKRFENSLFRYSEQFPGVVFQFRMYPDGRITFPFMSEKVEAMFGLPVSVVKPDASHLVERIVPEDRAAFLEKVEQSREAMAPFETDFRARTLDNGIAWIEARSVPSRLADDSTLWHGYFFDVTQRKQTESEIDKLAFYDPLTGLPNRRLLRDRLAQALAGSQRSRNYGALVFLDLNRFRVINDSAGHVIGDELLIQVGQRLQKAVRAWDTVARIGADEFVLVLKEFCADTVTVAATVEKGCKKIQDSLSEPYDLQGIEYTGSSSIGVTLFYGHNNSLEKLLSQADMALSRAKEAGPDSIRFYDAMMQEKVFERLRLDSDLRAAIRKNQFSVHYQVLVDELGGPVGAEALLRWNCPGRGMVPPAEFIPLAEEAGLIEQIGYWVLEDVLYRLARWKQLGGPLSQLKVAVNVSAKQFHLPSFYSTVMALLGKTGASPKNLKIEITESALAYDLELVEQTLLTFRRAGICISLDDFGTGYSSLGYLKRLSLDELKIDKGFVRDILTEPNDAAIAETILALASALRLSAVAEGVETKEQLARLVSMGCTRFQGYFFSRPLPLGEFEALINRLTVSTPT
jgi:diguanylate cyclase (GGDEF)-like protein